MADTKVFLSGGRIQGRSDDSVPLALTNTSWKELGRTKLTSSGSTCTVTGLASKDNLMILRHTIGGDTAIGSYLRVGNGSIDSGSNYADRSSYSGASDATSVSQTALKFQHSFGVYTTGLDVTYVRNIATKEKLFINNYVYQRAAGAGNVPDRGEAVGKWANTSNVIDQVQMVNDSGDTGAFQSDTELIVLGCDDDEADTGTNFWQELSDVDLSGGAATTLSTGTITAKKYLMVQVYSERNTSGTHQPMVTFNNDAGSNYAVRRQNNNGDGDAEQGWGSQSKGIFAWVAGNKHYTNSFIVNNASNEKLMMIDDIAFTTAGAGTVPVRSENLTKWANTSDPITDIKLSEQDGHTFDTQTSMRVWGSN